MQFSENIAKQISRSLGVDYIDDGIFWFASSIKVNANNLIIEIANSQLVGFDDLVVNSNVLKLSDLRKPRRRAFGNEWQLENVLLAGGSIMWVGQSILVTKRSADASIDANLWTTPAGRCDFTPYETSLKETVEEISIYSQATDKYLYPDICVDHVQKENNEFFSVEHLTTTTQADMYAVSVIYEGQVIENKNMWAWYDENSNTLETRLLLYVEQLQNVRFSNPEYQTKTALVNPSELNSENSTASLASYIGSLA